MVGSGEDLDVEGSPDGFALVPRGSRPWSTQDLTIDAEFLSIELMIFALSRKTDLALEALKALSTTDERVSGVDLATEIGTSVQFLPQIIAPLVRARWIDSERGPGGGYLALVPLESISLLDLIEATEGDIDNGRCVLRDGPCPGTESCPVHLAWMAAREVLIDKLDTYSVAQALSLESPA
jgi:Rrf2 family protein